MASLILKTYSGDRHLETYGKRNTHRLRDLLKSPEFHTPNATDAWGNRIYTADTFVLYTVKNERLFSGNVTDCMAFLAKYR